MKKVIIVLVVLLVLVGTGVGIFFAYQHFKGGMKSMDDIKKSLGGGNDNSITLPDDSEKDDTSSGDSWEDEDTVEDSEDWGNEESSDNVSTEQGENNSKDKDDTSEQNSSSSGLSNLLFGKKDDKSTMGSEDSETKEEPEEVADFNPDSSNIGIVIADEEPTNSDTDKLENNKQPDTSSISTKIGDTKESKPVNSTIKDEWPAVNKSPEVDKSEVKKPVNNDRKNVDAMEKLFNPSLKRDGTGSLYFIIDEVKNLLLNKKIKDLHNLQNRASLPEGFDENFDIKKKKELLDDIAFYLDENDNFDYFKLKEDTFASVETLRLIKSVSMTADIVLKRQKKIKEEELKKNPQKALQSGGGQVNTNSSSSNAITPRQAKPAGAPLITPNQDAANKALLREINVLRERVDKLAVKDENDPAVVALRKTIMRVEKAVGPFTAEGESTELLMLKQAVESLMRDRQSGNSSSSSNKPYDPYNPYGVYPGNNSSQQTDNAIYGKSSEFGFAMDYNHQNSDIREPKDLKFTKITPSLRSGSNVIYNLVDSDYRKIKDLYNKDNLTSEGYKLYLVNTFLRDVNYMSASSSNQPMIANAARLVQDWLVFDRSSRPSYNKYYEYMSDKKESVVKDLAVKQVIIPSGFSFVLEADVVDKVTGRVYTKGEYVSNSNTWGYMWLADFKKVSNGRILKFDELSVIPYVILDSGKHVKVKSTKE